jgi:dihydrofolate reductase
MGRLIMWNLVTLDGCFDGPGQWSLDWHKRAVDANFHDFALEQLRSADMLIFGRVTYEGMARYWRTATDDIADFMNGLPKIVFSRTLHKADWTNTVLKDDPVGCVRALKQQVTRNVFVFGSANLSATLANAGLFDEYRLAVTSVVLGKGRPLFGEDFDPTSLDFIDSCRLSSGCVVLRYEPK